MFLPGSRRYADPVSFLLTPQTWALQEVKLWHPVGRPVEATDSLAAAENELHTALADLETQLAKGDRGELRLGSRGGLSTKTPLALDGRGRPLSVLLTPDQADDNPQLLALLDAICVNQPAQSGR